MDKAKKRKLPPAGAGFALAFLLAALPGILLAAVGDIYRNDFSTRTSALPLPGDRWMSYDYDPNTQLYINYSGGGSTYNMWESNHLYQDAWGKPWMALRSSVIAILAWYSQMRMHSPQSMHLSSMMCARPSRTRMASVGQCFKQLVQPLHRVTSRRTE